MISIEPGTGGFDMPVVSQYVPQFDTPYYVVLGMSIACITSAIGLRVHLLCWYFCYRHFPFYSACPWGFLVFCSFAMTFRFVSVGVLFAGTICALFLCLFIFG
jgi:hypothetical protein